MRTGIAHGDLSGMRAPRYARGMLSGSHISRRDLAPRLRIEAAYSLWPCAPAASGVTAAAAPGRSRTGPGPAQCGTDTHGTVAMPHWDGYQPGPGPASRWQPGLPAADAAGGITGIR